jgi:hypothetical protein
MSRGGANVAQIAQNLHLFPRVLAGQAGQRVIDNVAVMQVCY